MGSPIYRFADFRLDPAARELRRYGRLLSVPPRVFDALAYLIEHRERAVGRDELISALWGRVDVADRQVTQVIMRARQAIGQNDEVEPQTIRTVYGFGYRWVAETDVESPSSADGNLAVVADGDVALPHVQSDSPSTPSRRSFPSRRLLWAAALAVVALIGTGIASWIDHPQSAPQADTVSATADAARQVVAVLPIEVRPPDAADAVWIRLGIMDLVADRLRRSGLAVPPSGGVASAVDVAAELPEDERLAVLGRTLAADLLIEGTATRADGVWKVELNTTAGDAGPHRVESEAADIVPAANRAADLLLAALGRSAPPDDDRSDTLSEVLQRVRAAMIAQQIDVAREILVRAPASMRNSPELRFELALAEYRSGRFREAEAITVALLDDPAVAADRRLRANVLRIRGAAAMMPGGDLSVAEPWFDAAVKAVDGAPWTPELADALAVRGLVRAQLHNFGAAILDLGRARTLFGAAGDRLGLGRVHNNLGILEIERRRFADAVPHLRAAIEINESFGDVRRLTASLSGLLEAQIQQLQWQDAHATADRLRQIWDRITNPVWRHDIGSQRATVLIALGRHDEAERVLVDLNADTPPLTNICEDEARVRLAWQRERFDDTQSAAIETLERWPSGGVALMLQRASIAAGVGRKATLGSDDAADDPAYLVAEAEWASLQGDEVEAERLFMDAMALAEDRAVPNRIVLVADAYGRWLIARERIAEASAVAGRVAGWADSDYDSALLQVAVLHAAGQGSAWSAALRQAQSLAGQRDIPAALLQPPG